jgi:MFS family permease
MSLVALVNATDTARSVRRFQMATTTLPEARAARARVNPLAIRDFRLLWAGQAVSSLGDQFALVALPWLALVLTGSALALGTVLALMAVPRAALMLFGGVYVDRLSPRRVMILSNTVRLVTVTLLGLIVIAGSVTMPMLYVFAVIFGVADAFFFPAQQAMIPAVVGPDEIPAANALSQVTTQLTVLVGPAAAGLLVAALGTSGAQPSLVGIGVALLVDALSFAVSLATLALIRGGSVGAGGGEAVLDALKAGLRFVWAWPSLRFIVLFAMGVNLLIVGPLSVGLPMLAYTRLPEGAAAYGTLMSAMGGGALLGMVATVALPRPRPAYLGTFVLSLMALMGIGLAALAVVSSTAVAVVLTALVGFGMGYGNLTFITWAQQRVPQALMGRVFGVILLGSVALVPISQVIAGALISVSLSGMLIVAGTSMTVVTLASAAAPAVRGMGLEPLAAEADGGA